MSPTEKTLEYFYDFSCPYAYLASTQIRALAARTGAKLVYKPFLLGGVYRALGAAAGDLANLAPARARMNGLDMHRWAEHWGVPLHMPATHPNRTVLALRATLASGDLPRASHALFDAYWARGENLSDPAVVSATLSAAGLDGPRLVALADSAPIKQELFARTDEAIARGVFGAPACFVGEELYWGQDRLDFVEQALGSSSQREPTGTVQATHGTTPGAKRAFVAGATETAPTLDFWYDFSSPFAYLASTQVEALAQRAGAKLRYRPFLLGALFKAIGTANVPYFAFSEAKRRYFRTDMDRHALAYGVPFRFPSRFPMRSVLALRTALAAGPALPKLTHALFRAAWSDDRDLEDHAELRAICREQGLAPELVDAAASEDAKRALRQSTDEALALGLCGAPSFVVGGSVYWGQDRLAFVERALAGWQPRVDSVPSRA